MAWYATRRVLQLIPVFFGATLLLYFMVYALPGDPTAAMGGGRVLTPAVREQLREQYHLNDGFFEQYWIYIKGVFTGDFGTSFSGLPVSEVMSQAFPITIRLALLALLFESVMGIGLGIIAGIRKGGGFDGTVLLISLIVIAIPIFVIGFVAQFLFGVKWGIAPATVGSKGDFKHLWLPAVVLASVSFAYILRLTRSAVAESLTADHVRTATAKGLSRPRGDHRARAAQRDDPRRHLSRDGSRCPDGGSDRHRRHLQHQRNRVDRLSQRDDRRGADRGLDRHRAGDHLSGVQPGGGSAVRAHRPEDSLCLTTSANPAKSGTSRHPPSRLSLMPWMIRRHPRLLADRVAQSPRRPMFLLSSAMILLVILVCLFPGMFTDHSPHACTTENSLLGSSGEHWFGTDVQGCDIFARTIYGARASVEVGVVTALIVFVVGGLLGVAAGFAGGWLDVLISRISDVFFALPLILAAIVILQMFPERNVWTVVAVLAAFGWPTTARIARSATLSVRNAEYITASRALGASRLRIMVAHVMPNVLGR
jgi:ABC-type dipeptide/oligopeptide/nickel transport system permease component